MRYRCNNPRTTNFERYGGRGISVCKEWDNTEDGFENFRDWALSHGYAENLTIDRINNDGNYEPENCKWSTELEQGGNKRNNINISLNGETHNAAEWSRRTGISAKCIRKRYKKGMNAEKILNIEQEDTMNKEFYRGEIYYIHNESVYNGNVQGGVDQQ